MNARAVNMQDKYGITEEMFKSLYSNRRGKIVIKYTGAHHWSPGQKTAAFCADDEYVAGSKCLCIDWLSVYGEMKFSTPFSVGEKEL